MSKSEDAQIARTQGLANGVLVLFHSLEEKTEILRPISSRKAAFKRIRGNHLAVDGFNAVRLTLALDLVKDCSRITFDNYDDSPSIYKVMERINDQDQRKKLREKHLLRSHNEENFDKEYERIYRRAKKRFARLESDEAAQNIRKARKKVVAHSDIKKNSKTGEYQLREINEFNISWKELTNYVNRIRPLVADIAYLVLATQINDASFTNSYRKISREFWKILS